MTEQTLGTRIAHARLSLSDRFWSSETTVMTTLAVLIGVGAGLGVVIFRRVLDGLFALTVDGIGHDFPMALIFLPAVGGLLVAGWMALASKKGETGLGVAGIMEAVALHSGKIGLQGSIARIIGAVLTVGTGGSAGPEDPRVQIGATIGSQVAQRLRLSETRVKTLVGCGAAAGLGAAFNAPITWFEEWSLPNWIKPALGGLVVGLLAYFLRPEILGTGYPGIGEALKGVITNPLILFGLVGLKLIATPLTIGSGGQGGLFAPSLFLGAMLGVGFGLIAQMLFPGVTAAAYGLVGMGAVLAGAVRAPITAILLPFEMTQDYRIILPLMFATVIASIVARRLEPESVYTVKLKQRGIDVRARKDVNLMRAITVEDAMTPVSELPTVKPAVSLPELTQLFQETSRHGFIVEDENDELYGVVTLSDLERALETRKTNVTVGDICTKDVLTTYPDETLDDALRNFAAMDVGRIPVVDRRHPRRVLGVLRRSDIVHAFSHALVDKHQRDHHIAKLQLEVA